MKNNIKMQLTTYCELYWWNMGKKTISFKGNLGDLLKMHYITFTKRKTESEMIFVFHFKSSYDITFKAKGLISNFTDFAKKAIQMELVRMGDKSQLYVTGAWPRSIVTVNN